MTEIPEHLRKRAAEARAKAEAAKAAAAGETGDAASAGDAAGETGDAASAGDAAGAADAGQTAAQSEAASKIPAHLLERSRAARAAGETAAAESAAAPSGGGGGTAVATAPPAEAPATTNGASVPSGPGGHTQRLLTVVKSGSIQDTKSMPSDKVHVWPHLLVVEFAATLFITAFTLIFSIFVNAPLLELANFNETPNPSKAPWYFLGLQELLTMFHPMVAGVTIPGIGLVVLVLAPYIDRNPSKRPEDRKFAISLMTMHLMFWAVLVMIGSFFRGPGFNFVFPWQAGLFFEL